MWTCWGKHGQPCDETRTDVASSEWSAQQAAETVALEAARIAKQGQWPAWIRPTSLTDRVPTADRTATGFDAGIACCLGLIPADRQELASRLHAAYTPQALQQARREIEIGLHPDSETCWWLAACAICEEGDLNQTQFEDQIKDFQALASDPAARRAAAHAEYETMIGLFEIDEHGVAFGTQDGCQQGAYLAKHDIAAMAVPKSQEQIEADRAAGNTDPEPYELIFIGTPHPSLGLEDFPWSTDVDDQGRPKSGGVHSSKQFMKCSTRDEYRRAIAQVRERQPQLFTSGR